MAVYLQKLEEVGVLKSVKVGRERIFLNPKLLNLLRWQEQGYVQKRLFFGHIPWICPKRGHIELPWLLQT